jgi:hypothetical protein
MDNRRYGESDSSYVERSRSTDLVRGREESSLDYEHRLREGDLSPADSQALDRYYDSPANRR